MNEDVLEALPCLAFFAILTVFYCVFRCCLAYCNNDDDHDHPTHPGHSLHVIKAAGISPSVLRSIPVVSYNADDFKDNVKCVVCLSKLVDGDKAKVLRCCNHCFHVDCIDTWLQSDSTCPIFRKYIEEIQKPKSRTSSSVQTLIPARHTKI
ncbi:Zinc finger RING-type [Arabidopsis thaliana x Arabidopsis arenosa]|uniref:Zinc finger RING-type n=1 Tax=Arabidopsis thaliana x Arabidopsis arenosa TaxID=1240361 RepID=A0A8T2AUE1_9BRAS|nr:Zinc finger RING-type [Arabidopsis thaliana x Arabidopsis arenosa]